MCGVGPASESAPTDALRLGRMRVFSEEVRRWKLPGGARPESVLGMAVGVDGSTHVLSSSFAGLPPRTPPHKALFSQSLLFMNHE